ncbi:hypothetical protein Ahy_A09g041603 isoform B [Arachis hypogaea]|uniref:Uncharacterized protein n=1 Tax=Arachis hypogaea TaxID=3818 RepID=A0A445BDA8_ARAHY|nr:hypothetical protein Ahy_A09g041603 isoform B [Arachis hypogaea]
MAENTRSLAVALRTLFSLLGAFMLATLLYTLFTDGSPFRKELLTPWMAATLIDFYINVVALAVWVAYKESNWISSFLWIIFLICFGSIATCSYIVLQFLKLSPQESSQDPMYYVLLRNPNKTTAAEPKRKNSFVVALRALFGILGVFMLGTIVYTLVTDGSPFRMELLTPWMAATLVDFYINVVAISVWIAYKESSWINAAFWIILLICFGSAATSTYIVWQLFQISCQDPVYLILVRHGDRQGHSESHSGLGAKPPPQPKGGQQVFGLRMTWLRDWIVHIPDEQPQIHSGSALLCHTYHTLCTAALRDVMDITGCMPLLVSWIYHRFPSFSPVRYDVVRFPLASRLAGLGQESRDRHDGKIYFGVHLTRISSYVRLYPTDLWNEEATWGQQHKPVDPVNVDDYLFKTTRGDDTWWPEQHHEWWDGGDPQHGEGDQQLLDEEAEYARQENILEGDIPAAHVELSTDAFFVDHEADMDRRLMLGTSIPNHHSADDTAWNQTQFNIGSDIKINIDDMFQIVDATGDVP